MWEEYLDNVEQVVADSLLTVQTNTETVSDTLSAKADEYGLHVSTAITKPWEDGALAISGYQETFDTAMSSTMDQLEQLELQWQAVIAQMDAYAAAEIAMQRAQNAATTAATYVPPAPENNNSNNNNNSNQSSGNSITVGGRINAGSARIYTDAYGGGGSRQYYSNDPIYVVVQEKNGYLLVRHHSESSGYTGWFKKSDVQAYAKGTTGVDEDQLALIDELGEELVMHADGNGKLSYLSKGTTVIPHDITENLMALGQLDPQDVLNRNRPAIVPNASIVNNNVEINMQIAEVVHIDKADSNSVPDITSAVEKQLDSYMSKLNNAIKAKVR